MVDSVDAIGKDPRKELISARQLVTRLEQRVSDLEGLLVGLLNEDQGHHIDPKRPVMYVRLSTARRAQMEETLDDDPLF